MFLRVPGNLWQQGEDRQTVAVTSKTSTARFTSEVTSLSPHSVLNMWVSGYLPSPSPSHEEKRDDEEEANILSCAIKWHLYNFCIYPTWEYPSMGPETSIIWTIHDQSQTNFAKFWETLKINSFSMRLKWNKKNPKEKQPTNPLKLKFKAITVNE